MSVSRIVDPVGRGKWAVRVRPQVLPTSLHNSCSEAIEVAHGEVARAGGGEVVVRDPGGQVTDVQLVSPPGQSQDRPSQSPRQSYSRAGTQHRETPPRNHAQGPHEGPPPRHTQDEPPTNSNRVGKVAKKIWKPFQLVTKSIVGISALIAAVTLILQFAPGVWRTANWRPVEYSILNDIHAGYNLEYFESKLGNSTLTDSAIPGAPGWRKHTFVRREYFVDVIVNETGRVEAYSVVTCNPNFTPTLKAPDGSKVALNSVPLARSQQPTSSNRVRSDDGTIRQLTTEELNNSRLLNYFPGKSVSSINSYLEAMPNSGSNAAGGWGLYVGISSACIGTSEYPDVFQSPDYKGYVDGAPSEAINIREKVAANLFCETAPHSPLQMVEDGRFTFVGNQGPKSSPEPAFIIGPYWGALPAELRNMHGTQVFNH
ncbi:DUF2188 domain-containing protein [Rhodococcus koreensis]|uniref:DUF2188 domain-containing protein n=1 Tax=Rhodococcus koreensis TaxID=99653 RepID=UPI00366A738D